MTLEKHDSRAEADAKLAPFLENWDPAVGLWTIPGPGHTPDTRDLAFQHPARESAWLLVAAGMDGVLDRVDAGRVLAALRAMQDAEGPRRGCFRWSWEDRSITDTNGSFFTGLALIVLHFEFGNRLATEDRALLTTLLAELGLWFDSEMGKMTPHALRYPNKCLGDLVCGWLLAEINGRATPELAARLGTAAAYYRDTPWGWGEHLSDIYATVMKFELTALFLYARQLDPALLSAYEGLFRNLLTLDTLFAEGPRVPAIRSYCLEHSPSREPSAYRSFLDALEPWTEAMPRRLFAPLRSLAHSRGFKSRFAVSPARSEDITVPCFGQALAFARVTDFHRLGVMSRYPLMDDAEHPSWGLCWQSMPVCYWNRNGDWAFLQWEASENGVAHAHPALSRHHRGHVQLTETATPPIVGETVGGRAETAFLAFRRMPRLSPGWPEVIDRFRLLNGTAASVVESRDDGWHTLTLDYPAAAGRPRHLFRVLFRPLIGEARMVLAHAEGRLDWEAHYPVDKGAVAGLWIWEAGETLSPPPACAAEGPSWRVTFTGSPPHHSRVISPSDATPCWSPYDA
jgi:hypothetical protein